MVKMNLCGRGFCPVPARLFWNEPGLTIEKAAAMGNCTAHALRRHAETLGLGDRWRKQNRVRVPLSVLKAAWLDEKTPLSVLSKRLGIYERYFQQIAHNNNWPRRKMGQKLKFNWPEDFDAMWFAGVSLKQIASTVGSSHSRNVQNEAMRRGLPKRTKGRGRCMPLSEFRRIAAEKAYADLLAKSARAEISAAKELWAQEAA